jgi:hypothetical protein
MAFQGSNNHQLTSALKNSIPAMGLIPSTTNKTKQQSQE